MARLDPLPADSTTELADDFAFFQRTLGFVPNSLLTMQRRPALTKGLIALTPGCIRPQRRSSTWASNG